jgi:hypothetical protein
MYSSYKVPEAPQCLLVNCRVIKAVEYLNAALYAGSWKENILSVDRIWYQILLVKFVGIFTL